MAIEGKATADRCGLRTPADGGSDQRSPGTASTKLGGLSRQRKAGWARALLDGRARQRTFRRPNGTPDGVSTIQRTDRPCGDDSASRETATDSTRCPGPKLAKCLHRWDGQLGGWTGGTASGGKSGRPGKPTASRWPKAGHLWCCQLVERKGETTSAKKSRVASRTSHNGRQPVWSTPTGRPVRSRRASLLAAERVVRTAGDLVGQQDRNPR